LIKINKLTVSNETKVGLLTAAAIAVLFLGYNYLKGKSVFAKNKTIYAIYETTTGLPDAAPVELKGLKVGVTGKKYKADKLATKIVVPIILSDDVIEIPKDALAIISGNPIGLSSSIIEIKGGTYNGNYLKNGDTILTQQPASIFSDISGKVSPTIENINKTVRSLDSVLLILASTMDPMAKANFQGTLANVNKVTSNLTTTTAQLENLIAKQSINLDKSLSNVNAFTTNLNTNNEKINAMLSNLNQTSKKLSEVDLNGSLKSFDNMISEVKTLVQKIGSNNGSLGLLMNDKDLYNQINNLTFSLNTLIDDVKVNPKRYISLFGRKDRKITPLAKPIYDSVPK
jgi:phospholipid/cholesterol/gamma-HCH transport system substrate-binding protein